LPTALLDELLDDDDDDDDDELFSFPRGTTSAA